MKFKILVYLFLFVCIVLFYQILNTNKILNHQDALLQGQFQSIGQLKDSLQQVNASIEKDAFFSLKRNQRLNELVFEAEEQEKQIMQKLFETNSKEGLKRLISLPDETFLIEQVKVINQQWVLIGFISDQHWGQAILEYSKMESDVYEFKLIKYILNTL
jgi:uncharacterized protein with NRDE domain